MLSGFYWGVFENILTRRTTALEWILSFVLCCMYETWMSIHSPLAYTMTAIFVIAYLISSVVWTPLYFKVEPHITSTLMVNLFVILPLCNVLVEPIVKVDNAKTNLVIGIELVVMMFVYEVMFGVAHYMMHKYGVQIHKVHHEFHELVGLTALYTHPLELLCVQYPSAIGGILCLLYWQGHVHYWSLCIWSLLMPISLVWTHSSGVSSKWDVLKLREFHLQHHKTPTRCFGTFSFVDALLGTR